VVRKAWIAVLLAAPLWPAVKLLDNLLDGIGVAKTTRVRQTHSR